MAQEKPNRLVEWILLWRRQWPVMRQHLADWVAACREEPSLIWQTPAVRYAVWGTGGLLAVWCVVLFAHAIAPPPPASAKPQATTADYHVICTDTNCGHHFVIHRKFGYRGFPVECANCGKQTGGRALRCNSAACRGRWVSPQARDGALICPRCDTDLQ